MYDTGFIPPSGPTLEFAREAMAATIVKFVTLHKINTLISSVTIFLKKKMSDKLFSGEKRFN